MARNKWAWVGNSDNYVYGELFIYFARMCQIGYGNCRHYYKKSNSLITEVGENSSSAKFLSKYSVTKFSRTCKDEHW